ncbi:MAG: hypothetical protein WC192_04885, partial [Candidatus Babeliales bacterium]
MKKNLFNLLKTNNLTLYILCLGVFSPIKIVFGQIRVGDIVKIENLGTTGAGTKTYLADNGTQSALLATGNIEWVIKRVQTGVTEGTLVTSGMFPKLMNKATGKYLGGTASGIPIPMTATNYGTGEFWTPVDIDPSTNIPNTVDNLLNKFRSTAYPNQYTYVLYSGLAGTTSSYWPTSPTPTIKTPVYYDRKVVFVSNGGYVLVANASNQVSYASTISNANQNMWYIRLVRTYIQEAFSIDLPAVDKATSIPVALNTLINTPKYLNIASTLIDFPSSTNSVSSRIDIMAFVLAVSFAGGFLGTLNPPTTISAALLQTLKETQTTLSNSNLSKYLTANQQTNATNLLAFVNFILELNNATTPSTLITIVNNSKYLSSTK